MSGRFNITNESNMKTLELIAKGKNISIEIAKERKISTTAQHYTIKILEREGYITQQRKGMIKIITLTQKALDILLVGHITGLITHPTIRIHKFEVHFKLKDPLGPNEPPQIAMRHGIITEPVFMQNHTDSILKSFKLKARLYPSALVIYGPEIEAMPENATIIDLVNKALDAIEEVAWDIEQRMQIKLKKLSRNTLIGKLIDQHIAIKNDPWAKWLREHGMKITIPDDLDGGEPLWEMDFSHNIDESESHNLNKGDKTMQNATDMIEATVKGEITAESIKTTEKIIKEQNQFFINHNKLIQEIRELIAELRKERGKE